MQKSFPAIADAFVFRLLREENKLTLLSEDSHLLRRFGQLDVLDLTAGSETDYEIRAEADRFVFPIAGSVRATLIDLRSSSPSRRTRMQVELDVQASSALLAPFGVALSLHAESDARIVMLSTHGYAHAEDRILATEDLDKYLTVQ